ncbi:MAG: hypothetical protein ING36_01460 [Burkholderiales bacterium]|jgi:hypothetical protein|nr:hypothetical protein [Burkholderiales bacterium]
MKKWLPCFMMLVTLVVQAQSGTDSAREVVEGSLIGFVQAPVGKALPELFMAPDGKPDLIFLPKIAGKQDALIRTAIGKTQTFETFFGGKRFQGKLLAQGEGRRLNWKNIQLADGSTWFVQRDWEALSGIARVWQMPLSRPEEFEPVVHVGAPNECEAPGFGYLSYNWPGMQRSLHKLIVMRLPWREFPCQGVREEPTPDIYGKSPYWRRYISHQEPPSEALPDLRRGVFVGVTQTLTWAKQAGIKVTPFTEPRYVVHLDSQRNYPPAYMLRADLLLLDAEALRGFRNKVRGAYPKKDKEREECIKAISSKIKYLSKQEREQYEFKICDDYNWDNRWIDSEFINTFIPETVRQLWQP